MNWEAIGTIAELVGAIGVIVSLIFVGIQIRKNTLSAQANTLQNSIGADVGLLVAAGASPDTARVFFNYLINPDSLTENELIQGRYLFAAAYRHWENMYIQYRSGAISEEAWQARMAGVRATLLCKGYDEFISSYVGEFLSGVFMDYAREVRKSKV